MTARPPIIDARGRELHLERLPERIVSLVPSTTETLHDLGAADRVVGVTRYCVHPQPWVASLPRVGGTKDVSISTIQSLRPDLIVGNCEENTREIFQDLEAIAPVYAAFPRTVDDALEDLARLGTLIGTTSAAAAWQRRIETARNDARRRVGPTRFAYLIWRKPWMTINADTFISAMLHEVGGVGVFADHPDRFPTVTADAIGSANPDVVLLSSEPFPFADRHRDELVDATGLPSERFTHVDGELLSWHGTRMAAGLTYAAEQASTWPSS